MRLAELVQAYCLAREVSPPYKQQLAIAVDLFGRWLGHGPTTADLVDDAVNRWLVAYAVGRRPATVRGKRGHLLAVWRWAFTEGLVDVAPRRVRKVSLPRTLPEAWQARQLAELLVAADQMPGWIRRWRRPWGAYFRGVILAGYDTGFRLGDLLALRWDQIGTDGAVLIVQHKTGWPLLTRLRLETLAALERLRHPDMPRPLGLCGPVALRRRWRGLVRSAGLVGPPKMLRKSGATAVELACPGAAMYYLGHRTPGLAHRHYVDPRIAGQAPRQPPPLVG